MQAVRAGVLLVLLQAALACCSATAQNLIKNPGFEEGMSGWSSSVVRSPGGEANVSVDASAYHSGKASAGMTLDFREHAQVYCPVQTVQVFPDTDYLLSAWIKTSLASGSIHVELQDVRGWKLFLAGSRPLGGQNDWTKVEIAFRTSLSTEGIVLGLRHVGRPGDGQPMKGQVWLDDVVLLEKGTGRPRLSKEELEKAIRDSKLITLENPALRITFSEPRLRIRSVEFKKRPDLKLSPGLLPEVPLYQIRLRGPEGQSETIHSVDAQSVSLKSQDVKAKGSYVLEANHSGAVAKISVYVTLNPLGFIDLRLEAGPPERGWLIRELIFPQAVTNGLLSDAPGDTYVGGEKPTSLGTEWQFQSSFYPTNPRIPMLYQYGTSGGMYLLVLDSDQWVKKVEMLPYMDDARTKVASIAWRCSVNLAAGDRLPKYTARLGRLEDSPYEAAAFYRAWASRQPWFPAPLSQRKDLGSWRLRGAPHYYVYLPGPGPNTLQKHPRDMTPEEIQEYHNKHQGQFRLHEVPMIMEVLPREIAELDGVVDLRGWEKWGLWMNPDWWPPRQGEKALRQAIGAIHKVGLHVTADVMFNELSIHKSKEQGGFAEKGLRAVEALGLVPDEVAIKSERGEILTIGAAPYIVDVVCPTVRASFDHTAWTLARMKEAGFDDVQFDGGGSEILYPCWNKKHLHPEGCGYWQTAVAKNYFERLRDAIPGSRQSGFGFSEEYYNEVRARSYVATYTRCEQDVPERVKTLIGKRLTPVPGMFSFVYHGRVIEDGFFPTWGPVAYAAAANIAFGVCAGPQSTPWLTFRHILKEPWVRIFLAGTKARQTFARNYLLLGQMLKPIVIEPWVKIQVSFKDDSTGQWTTREVEVPAVLQQAYRSPEGRIGWVLVNHTDRSVTCIPQPPLPPWFTQLSSRESVRRVTIAGAEACPPGGLRNLVVQSAEVVLVEQG